MKKFKKILVVCVNSMVTGGPEALHHLVHCMRNMGMPAFLCYDPFDQEFDIPEPYREFNVKTAPFDDSEGNLIIFPEVYPMEALKIHHAQAAIWWLSLDNFLERRHISPLHDKARYFKRVLQRRRPPSGVKALQNILHFSQSHYASEYLKIKGIQFTELFEPINKRFLLSELDTGSKKRIDEVLYNPSKGKKITQHLIKFNPKIKFTPLKGFTRSQLTEKFQTAKVYIDFGHHPGRDRLPREAAIHGCCIITGQLGSAKNSIDIPIPSNYKLDHQKSSFDQDFNNLLNNIFSNYENHHHAFNSYRTRIMDEPRIFEQQIKEFFLPRTYLGTEQ